MKSKSMTEKVSLEPALTYIGYGFTTGWIEEKQDPRLSDFLSSAECCRKDSRRYYKLILFAIAMFVIAVGSAYALSCAFRSSTSPWWLVLGLACSTFVSGFLGLVSVFCGMPSAYPGETKLRVAKDWEKWRKSVLSTGIATRLADRISEEQRLGTFATYNLPAMQDIIADIVQCRMASVANDVKAHERDGFESRRKKARALFSELQLIAHAMGIKVKPTAYYFA